MWHWKKKKTDNTFNNLYNKSEDKYQGINDHKQYMKYDIFGKKMSIEKHFPPKVSLLYLMYGL